MFFSNLIINQIEFVNGVLDVKFKCNNQKNGNYNLFAFIGEVV